MSSALANPWFWVVASAVGVLVLSVVAFLAICAWVASAELSFKRRMVDGGLPAGQIERILAASSWSDPVLGGLDEEALGEVVSALADLGVAAGVTEQVLTAFRQADLATQRHLAVAIRSLLDGAGPVDGEHVMAVVRPLCRLSVSDVPAEEEGEPVA